MSIYRENVKADRNPVLKEESFVDGTTPHMANFFDCIKTRKPTNANPKVMRHSHIACHAAAISWMLGRTLKLDPATESFVGDDEANRMRSRAAREPWCL